MACFGYMAKAYSMETWSVRTFYVSKELASLWPTSGLQKLWSTTVWSPMGTSCIPCSTDVLNACMHSTERPSPMKVETVNFRKGLGSFGFNQPAIVSSCPCLPGGNFQQCRSMVLGDRGMEFVWGVSCGIMDSGPQEACFWYLGSVLVQSPSSCTWASPASHDRALPSYLQGLCARMFAVAKPKIFTDSASARCRAWHGHVMCSHDPGCREKMHSWKLEKKQLMLLWVHWLLSADLKSAPVKKIVLHSWFSVEQFHCFTLIN